MGTCVHLWLIHADGRQRPAQYCNYFPIKNQEQKHLANPVTYWLWRNWHSSDHSQRSPRGRSQQRAHSALHTEGHKDKGTPITPPLLILCFSVPLCQALVCPGPQKTISDHKMLIPNYSTAVKQGFTPGLQINLGSSLYPKTRRNEQLRKAPQRQCA